MIQTFIDVTQTRKSQEIERHYVRGGLDAWLRITAAPLAEGVALTIEDISQRKSADDDLAEYVSEVERSRDQIHKQSVLLQWQAEELTQARDEALAGTREMETALGMQADFVSFASHQLRTPLAGIKWLLELAMEEPGVEGELRSYLVDSRESAERLIGLVNDLLDIARLEGGRTVAAPAPVDLAALCRDLTGQMQPNVAKRQHTLSVSGIDDPAPVFVDGAMVLQAIQNLLSNAIKYTPDGGQVRMALTREGADIICTVEDSGIGVPEAARGRLFEKFFRADNVLTMETEGTGLGLFMVRLILEKFGGRIWYEPGTDGTGSRFAFALPAYEESNDPGQADLDSRGRSCAA
jgi:signal transduction histidine kinase